jgi:ATP-dependent DNA helicase PIF1
LVVIVCAWCSPLLSGKSFLISRILSCLPGVGSSTFATSTTGITASHIGGTTLFAWAGWSATAGAEGVEELVQRVARSRESLARWRSTRTLLVDEVSMLDAALFDRLEAVARRVRGDERPFGGIQLILCGDYFQLPPVTKDGGGMNASASANANAAPLFAFESQSWSRCVGAESGGQGRTIELGVVFRQRDDVFIRLLDSVRRGQCPPDAAALLRACEDTDLETLASEDGIRPTSLVSHRKEVEETNTRELALLQTTTVTFHARDTSSSSQALEALSAACPARAKLELKIGAQVLLLRNLGVSSGLSNGARGVVVRFGASLGGGRPGPPVVRFASGSETTIAPVTWSHSLGGQVLASREQVPLELAWALSIHKSQGLTLDRARIDISRCFEHGQAYVALSRMRGLDGLQLVGGFDPKKIRAHPRVIAFYEQLGEERAAAEKARSDKAKAAATAARATQMQAQQRAQAAAAAAAAGKPLPIPATSASLSAPSISSALMQPSSLSGRVRKSRDDDEEDEKKQMDAPPAAAANQPPPSDEEDDEQPGLLLPVLGRKLHFEPSDNGNKRRRRRLAVSSSDSDDDEDDHERGEGQTRSRPAAAAPAALPPLDAFYPPPSSLPLRAL